jgi:hypothetical protein
MRRHLAKEVLYRCEILGQKYDPIFEAIGLIEDEEEKKKLKKMVQESVASLVALELYLVRQWPDLDPKGRIGT